VIMASPPPRDVPACPPSLTSGTVPRPLGSPVEGVASRSTPPPLPVRQSNHARQTGLPSPPPLPPMVAGPDAADGDAAEGVEVAVAGVTSGANGFPFDHASESHVYGPLPQWNTGEPARADRERGGSEGAADRFSGLGRYVGGLVSMVIHVLALLLLAILVLPHETKTPLVIVIDNVVHEEIAEVEELAVEVPVMEPEAEFPEPDIDMVEVPMAPMEDHAALLEDMQLGDVTPFELDVAVDEADLLANVPGAHAGEDVLGMVAAGRPRQGGAGLGGQGFGGEVGRRLAMAGARTGDVQVSLAWNNVNDIDLHVVAPSGERIFFGHRWSRCGGGLDVDMNVTPATPHAVENIFWPHDRAPRGEYAVLVHHFCLHVRLDPTPFEVHVLVRGRKAVFRGVVSASQGPVLVARFNLDGEGLPVEAIVPETPVASLE
jgi:hypothetical protein